uniref:Uncharacterized protein n=1 Tax=Stomoxys calcitrans TaxID=35570 RepID=A0A1I8Q904_STOCA
MTYNLQFQYGVPPEPIYWWDKWDRRNFASNGGTDILHTDEAQEFLYAFAEQLMDRRQQNGRQCLLKAICENAQIHVHQGLYSELLHRFLRPHYNMDAAYVDAWHMGQKGVDCQTSYPKATNCLLDQHTHVQEDLMGQTSVK